jgi:putative redox protein
MPQEVEVTVTQISPTASEAVARKHSAYCDRPEAKGGTDKGPMGGEMMLMGLGGCFMSNLLAAVKARGLGVSGLHVEVVATLAETPPRFSEIELKVSGDYQDKDLMNKLVTIAERGCIVANTIRDSVKLTFSIA